MTTAEAALAARRTPTTIRKWILNGRLTATTVAVDGPPWVVWSISESDLANAIATQRRPGRPYKVSRPDSGETIGLT